MSIPKILQYGTVKPKGYATSYKRWEVTPQSSYNQFNPNELIRFTLQTDGWLDPYKSYIEIWVSCDKQTFGGVDGFLEMDGPGTSLINEMVLYSDSKELERISEYDQLGNILYDLGLMDESKKHKQYEGCGYMGPVKQHNTSNQWIEQPIGCQATVSTQFCNGFQPTKLIPAFLHSTVDLTGTVSNKSALTYSNLTVDFNVPVPGNGTQQENMYQKIMYQRMPNMGSYDQNYALTSAVLDSDYGVDSALSQGGGIFDGTNASNACWMDGYLTADSNLTGQKGEYISTLGAPLKIVNGSFNTDSTASKLSNSTSGGTVTTRNGVKQQLKVFVPILSGVLGILIPRSEWKLIPGKALGQMLFEFRLNPYAFFTAGAMPGSGGVAPQRQWKITYMSMVFDLWNFDQALEDQMHANLQNEGLILSSNSWSLGPIYTIVANGTVTNNWQINNGIESVKSIVFWFLANDYLYYPHCRKNYRLSMNIAQIQIKIGPDYIPPYPIQGHSGNIGMNADILDDNTEFVVELHKTFGKFFASSSSCAINKTNFAINDRPYAVSNVNMCSNGQALFHERRCVGKALYAFNLDSNPNDSDVLSGLDTTQKRPIELIIKGTDLNKFQRDTTMFVMLNHDFYVQFTLNGTKTYGSG